MSTDRSIPDRLRSPLEQTLKSWESLLLLVAIGIFVANSFASPYFLNAWNLSDATFNFTEKAMIAFAMALLIIAGEIDLSVAAIIALASTAMGAAAQVGVGTEGLVRFALTGGDAATLPDAVNAYAQAYRKDAEKKRAHDLSPPLKPQGHRDYSPPLLGYFLFVRDV